MNPAEACSDRASVQRPTGVRWLRSENGRPGHRGATPDKPGEGMDEVQGHGAQQFPL